MALLARGVVRLWPVRGVCLKVEPSRSYNRYETVVSNLYSGGNVVTRWTTMVVAWRRLARSRPAASLRAGGTSSSALCSLRGWNASCGTTSGTIARGTAMNITGTLRQTPSSAGCAAGLDPLGRSIPAALPVCLLTSVDRDRPPQAYWAPGILTSLGLVGLNLISWEAVAAEDAFGDNVVRCARMWTMGSLMLLFGGLGTAIWMVVDVFSVPHYWPWGGVCCLIQTVFITLAAFLFRVSRRSGDHAI